MKKVAQGFLICYRGGMADRLVTIYELAELWGITPQSVDTYASRDGFPEAEALVPNPHNTGKEIRAWLLSECQAWRGADHRRVPRQRIIHESDGIQWSFLRHVVIEWTPKGDDMLQHYLDLVANFEMLKDKLRADVYKDVEKAAKKGQL